MSLNCRPMFRTIKPLAFVAALVAASTLHAPRAYGARVIPSPRTPGRTIAVLPTSAHGAVPSEIQRAVETSLEREITRNGLTPLPARAVADRLKGTPAIEHCGSDIPCLSRLASTLKVDAVVLISAEQVGSGHTRCDIRVVAASGRLEHQANVEISGARNVDAALSPVLPMLFTAPAALASASSDDLELVPLMPTPAATPPPADTARAGTPAAPGAAQPAPNPATPAVGSTSAPVPMTPPPPAAPPSPLRSHILAYTGAGVGVVSLALFGGGLYYHVQAEQTYAKAQAIDPTTQRRRENQPSAAALKEKLNAQYDRRDVLLVVGGAMAAISATLLAVDLLWLNNKVIGRAHV